MGAGSRQKEVLRIVLPFVLTFALAGGALDGDFSGPVAKSAPL
jgi:hypothetical protein